MRSQVAREQLRLVYRHLPAAIVPPILAAAIIAYVFRDLLPHAQLQFWVGWVAVSYALLPTGLWIAYRKNAGPLPDIKVWGRCYVIMVFFTASSWGAAGVFLYVPDSPLLQLFLGAMLFTSAASVMATTFAYTPGYYAGVIPILFPIAIRVAMAGGAVDLALSGIILLSFLMFGYFQYSLHKGLSESLAMRFERETFAVELARKNQEIEMANHAKSRFLAAASHDLRQPMHAQQLFLAELDARLSNPQEKTIVSHIRQSMQSMGSLLDGLLDISELEAGVVHPNSRGVLLQPLLDRIENEFSGLMTQKGLRFRVVNCRRAVYSDPVLLVRMLRNLVHNALRYTSSGAVMIACRRRGETLEIQIRDSGPGIPPDQHQQVFEEFTQIGNRERQRDKGFGLGLSIVARLARLLDHPVELRSRLGAGSTFLVRVPLVAEATLSSEVASDARGYGNALEGWRVLVVEDDRDTRLAVAMLLERWRCETRLAADGAEALQMIRGLGAAPDVIITDYRLPGDLSGIEVARNIRAEMSAPIPAVLITGDTASQVLREAQANDCILMYKPVDAETLYTLLCHLRYRG